MHNYVVLSSIISVIYTIVKFALKSQFPQPDLKDSGLLFVSSILGLYIFDNFINVVVTPKVSEIFTDPPGF
jgi:hypothetical protein